MVEFNAWHYNDDHLWVRLIEQLFRQLRHDPTATDSASQEEAEDLATVQARLGRARTRQERPDRQLADLERLDPERGWFGQLVVLRRAVVAARAAGQDAAMTCTFTPAPCAYRRRDLSPAARLVGPVDCAAVARATSSQSRPEAM